MDDLRPQALREIAALEESIRQFKAGEITPERFRPRRLSYGIYAQLPHTSNMLRVKLPAGLVTARQLEALADVGDKYGRGLGHVTTRQAVQFHWIPLEACPEIFRKFLDVGIINRGSCSDSIRNVTTCHMSGTCQGEHFDVLPYAKTISEYFLFHPLNLTLPRKFKISISGCSHDCALGSMHEIGLVAASRKRGSATEHGFVVKAAGGLGSLPHLARQVRDFVPAEDILIVCEGIVRLFHKHGNRKNRLRARMKFLMRKLGIEEYKTLLDEEIAAVEAEKGAELTRHMREEVGRFQTPPPMRPNGVSYETELPEDAGRWLETNITPQKQDGYNTVLVKLPLGDVTSDQMRGLATIVRELGNGTIRTTVSQNLAIPFIHNGDVPEVYARLGELELIEAEAHHITDVVSCPGADYCSIAITKSLGVGAKVRDHLQQGATDIEKLGDFRIQISGCPNACGQHHIGDLGLTGLMVKGTDGVERPHYSILVGGGITGEAPALARRLKGKYPEEETPKILAAFANHYLDNRLVGESFKDFVERIGLEVFEGIALGIARVQRVEVREPSPAAID